MATYNDEWFFFNNFFGGDPKRFLRIKIRATVEVSSQELFEKIEESHLLEVGGGDFSHGSMMVLSEMDSPIACRLKSLSAARKIHGWLLSRGFFVEKSETTRGYDGQKKVAVVSISIVYTPKRGLVARVDNLVGPTKEMLAAYPHEQALGDYVDNLPEPTDEQLVVLRENNMCVD